jgi:hypothetical protein
MAKQKKVAIELARPGDKVTVMVDRFKGVKARGSRHLVAQVIKSHGSPFYRIKDGKGGYYHLSPRSCQQQRTVSK